MFKPHLLLVPALLFSPLALADGAEAANRFTFNVSAQSQVENDLMVVTLGSQHQSKDMATAASEVNTTMGWALEQLKGVQGIKQSTVGYQSQPVYGNKGREIHAWRVSQQLRLQGTDFELLSEKIQLLQGRLALKQVQFSVQNVTRESTQEELTSEVLAKFRKRAQLIADQMGASGYTTVRVDLGGSNNNNYYPRPQPMMRMEVASTAAPAMAGGESEVTVSVSAEIELIR